MSVIVKGDSVEFVRTGDGHVFRAPTALVLVHDTKGSYLRKCDFYVVAYTFRSCSTCKADAKALQEAERYYGSGAPLETGSLDLPRGAWKSLFSIDAIRYRRKGEHADHYQHRYASPQPLYFLDGRSPSFRIRSPDGCVANERGFVYP